MHRADVRRDRRAGASARSRSPTATSCRSATTRRSACCTRPATPTAPSCFLFRSTVFSGDTLFAGSVGGIFADVSTYDDLLASVRFKLFALDDDTVVMPGHGPPTTIGEEKAHNPFF